MKRLILDIDNLQVESFDTATEPASRGTVLARQTGAEQCTTGMDCPSERTGPCCSQWGTYCGGTCETTCLQKECACTGADWTVCDYTCATCGHDPTCLEGCPTRTTCPTSPGYPGCS